METMPRPRPPHLVSTRHGTPVWYVRIGHGPRVRLRAEFGSPDFDAEYQAALTGAPRAQKAGVPTGSLAWLIDRYRETSAWAALSNATRLQRENIYLPVVADAGHHPFIRITGATIEAGRDRRADTPAQARNFLDAMRGLFDGRSRRSTSKQTPRSALTTRRAKRAMGSLPGPRNTSKHTNANGPSVHGSACGSTYCFTRACAVAMPCASGVSTSAMALGN